MDDKDLFCKQNKGKGGAKRGCERQVSSKTVGKEQRSLIRGRECGFDVSGAESGVRGTQEGRFV